LNEDIAEIEGEIEELGEDAVAAQKVEEEIDAKMAERTAQQEEIGGVEEKLKGLIALLEAYQDGFRSSVNIEAGEKLTDLRMPDGRVLKEAEVTVVSPEKVQLKHPNGFASLDLDQLPSSLQDRVVKPPETDGVSSAAQEALTNKPNSLKTAAELAAAKDAAKQDIVDAVDRRRMELSQRNDRMRKEREARDQKALADREKMVATQKAKQELRVKLNAQIDTLEDEIRVLEDAIEAQDKAKEDALARMAAVNLRPSMADIDKVAKAYDTKIRSIEAQINAKETEITKLKREMAQ
ncbi:MAG: hypothetical protein HKN23_21230, partial [Verrucomicrobiales bacterium]|nr:hypothetical protein [Verrucomicrobiales bacterium]